MKRLKGVLLVLVLAVCSVFAFGCNDNDNTQEAKKIASVKQNGLREFYYVTEDVDFNSTTLEVSFKDKTKVTFNKVEVDIEPENKKEDTQFIIYTDGLEKVDDEIPAGDYEIKYIVPEYMSEKANLMTITVSTNQSLVYDLDSYELPQFIQTYNTVTFSATDEAKFYETEKAYYVGDDNEFVVKPNFELSNSSTGAQIESDKAFLNTEVKVEQKLGTDNYSVVGSDYYKYNPTTYGIDFEERAVNGTFRITLKAKDFEEDLNNNEASVSFEVVVADGWNVIDAKDLGRMNIYGANEGINEALMQILPYFTESTSTIWQRFLGIEANEAKSVNGIFLHNDIVVHANDVPSEYFVTETESEFAAGSLRDYSTLYAKYMNSNNFTFNGNFFVVDLSEFPIGLGQGETPYYSEETTALQEGHSRAFHFMGNMKEYNAETQTTTGNLYDGQIRTTGKVDFRNVNFVGNIDYNEDKTKVNTHINNKELKAQFACGGIIGVATEALEAKYENVIAKNMYIPYYSDGNSNVTINKAKAYDCFNCALYCYRAPLTNITGSEFKRFGGPAIFLNCSKYADQPTVVVNVDANTKIENFVQANSAWFNLYNAGLIVSGIIQNEAFAANHLDHLYYEYKTETETKYLRYAELRALGLVSSRADLLSKANQFPAYLNFISIGFSSKGVTESLPTKTVFNYNVNIPFDSEMMRTNNVPFMPSNNATAEEIYNTEGKNNFMYLLLSAEQTQFGTFAITFDFVPYEYPYAD